MELSIYEMIKDFITSLGFPIFVAVWLLWRMERLLRNLTKTIDELGVLIITMLPSLERLARSERGGSHGEDSQTPESRDN